MAVFVLAIGALLASCGPPGRHSAEPQAAHPCQAAQLRASLPGDSGHAGIEEVTFGLTNESPEVCVLDGYPLLTASTVAHRPFTFGVSDLHGNGSSDPFVWPLPRAIVLHHNTAAYFLSSWVDSGGFETGAALTCVDNFYARIRLVGQRRPVGPPLLVYSQVCVPRGDKPGATVSAFFHCSLSTLTLPPVTSQPRRASDYCLAPR